MFLIIFACAISIAFGSHSKVNGKVSGVKNENCNACTFTWQLAYRHESNGCSKEGSKYSLISAISSGARVRVVLGTSYSAEVDKAWVHNGDVFAQLLHHVSKSSWNRFQDDAYWFWMIVSTDGLVQRTRYNVGSNVHRGTDSERRSIKWYVKQASFLPHPSYSHLANGERVDGQFSDLERSVQKGHDIRGVRDKAHFFPMQNVAIKNDGVKFIVGQNLDAVSVHRGEDRISFQSDPYWFFRMINTNGYQDVSRWSVGTHKSRGHTDGTSAMEWFADSCWKLVYHHDKNGKSISGSLGALTSAILSGHRVRVQFPNNHYTVEPEFIKLRNAHVTAQILNHVSTADMTRFQDDAYWYWQMASTTGTVRSTRYNIGEHKHRGDSTEKLDLKWFVDTRTWNDVFTNDKNGKVVGGERSKLVGAVVNGAEVRCVVGNSKDGFAYKADNLAVSPDGQHVAVQTLGHVSIKKAPNAYEVMIQSNAYWWFTIVSTTGLREMSRWTVGVHVARGRSSDQVGQKWFVNY